MSSYQIPGDRPCQVCGARITDPASWLCGACGAVKAPPPRPGGIRGFLSDLYQIRPFVIFAVVLLSMVIAMAAAGGGSILFVGHLGGDDCNPLSTP